MLTFDLCRLTFAFYNWTARQAHRPFPANVERQLECQAMNAPNCFSSVVTYRWCRSVAL